MEFPSELFSKTEFSRHWREAANTYMQEALTAALEYGQRYRRFPQFISHVGPAIGLGRSAFREAEEFRGYIDVVMGLAAVLDEVLQRIDKSKYPSFVPPKEWMVMFACQNVLLDAGVEFDERRLKRVVARFLAGTSGPEELEELLRPAFRTQATDG